MFLRKGCACSPYMLTTTFIYTMAGPKNRNYALLLLGWIILFLSQRSVPSTASYLRTSASFSVEAIGSLFSCFAITYALTKLASGFLYDSLRLSPKVLFCWGLGIGGFLLVLFPTAAETSVALACFLWLVVGIFHGFGWPACAQMTKQWYEPSELGKRYSILSSASNIAAAVSPMLSLYLATAAGWKTVYYLLGTTSLAVTPLLVFGMEKTSLKRENASTIQNGAEARPSGVVSYSWYSVFKYKEFWLTTALNITAWTVKASVVDWMLLYLTHQLNYSHSIAAWCAAVNEIGAVVGKLSFAALSDTLLHKQLLIRKGLTPRAPVILLLTVPLGISASLYSYITSDSNQLWLMAVLFTFGFSAGGMIGMCSLSLMESVPHALAATSLGIGDSLTHFVGRSLLGYTLFSYLANHSQWGWTAAYRMTGTLAITSSVTALLLTLSPTTPYSKDKEL